MSVFNNFSFSLLFVNQGDSVSDWYEDSFQMFKNGSRWIPPPINSYTKGETENESYEKARRELENKKGRLTNE